MIIHLFQVPARINKLIDDNQLYAAVQVHVQSARMLEREGLQTVSRNLTLFRKFLGHTTSWTDSEYDDCFSLKCTLSTINMLLTCWHAFDQGYCSSLYTYAKVIMVIHIPILLP